jgi:hypothetical protein
LGIINDQLNSHRFVLRADCTRLDFFLNGFATMPNFVFFQAILETEILKLAFIADWGKKAFAARNVLLAITTDFKTFLVILQTLVAAKLLDIGTKPNTIFTKRCSLNRSLAGGTTVHLILI